MIRDSSRLKLLHAIAFFTENTKFCGKIKLFKLVYFLDFGHYSEVGRNVTGLTYHAWPKGPVPVSLNDEIEDENPELTHDIEITKKNVGRKYPMLIFRSKIAFDEKLFSKRELRIMQSLADDFYNHYSEDMIEATHLENQPWHQIYEVENKHQELIPYDLALKGSEYLQASGAAKEHREFIRNF